MCDPWSQQNSHKGHNWDSFNMDCILENNISVKILECDNCVMVA